MRDRRAGRERRRRVHLHVAAGGMAAGGERRRRRHHGAPRPVQVGVVDRRGRALGIREARPGEPEAVILEELHEHVVAVVVPGAARERDVGLEAEPVAELVEDDRHEIELRCAGVAVEAVVPRPRKRAGRADRAVEGGGDVAVARGEVRAGELVGERLGIVRVRVRSVGEVVVDGVGAGRAEGRARGGAGERIHRGVDLDGDAARQLGAPQAGGIRERVEPLVAERRPGVSADRTHRGRVVEALAGAVVVDDGDRGGGGGARGPCGEGEQDAEKTGAAGHRGAEFGNSRRTHSTRTLPSASMVATASLMNWPSSTAIIPPPDAGTSAAGTGGAGSCARAGGVVGAGTRCPVCGSTCTCIRCARRRRRRLRGRA